MEYLIPLLIVLFILLVFVTLVGHGIWVLLAWFFRTISSSDSAPAVQTLSLKAPAAHTCPNCHRALTIQMKFCGVCGAQRLTLNQEELLGELEVTLRQIERLLQAGEYETDFRALKFQIETERERILFPNGRPKTAQQPSPSKERTAEHRPVEEARASSTPFITPVAFEDAPQGESAPHFETWSKDSDEAPIAAPILKTPRKPFADVLAAFMEETNVRWGEIIGGLLIIGCSTALVISLWAQISRVPVMKFLIFTTVTAALFGVGFYTEHHWKLPTTSRGILTIATLLVPLNFLAIAAVSTNTTPGILVVGSEIIAPALFLCLVYFAGRVITSKWPHVLAAGALGSSVGQLLIRHLGGPEISPNLLIALGAFPIVCYVAASGWTMKIALADGEIDETESIEIFITLGALTFAAVLPFGLLLYRSESVGMSMIHLAPLVTLGGMPMLASGMLLWRRSSEELNATRTAGASIAILGMMTALAGMVLAWPNPASIVPAALFNFVLFTTAAVALDEPRAHVLAAGCLTLAYVVGFHVLLGHVPWGNLRVVSLLRVTASVSTGQSLAVPFLAFVGAYEWLRSRRGRDAVSYLIVACAVAIASLIFLAGFGIGVARDPFHISAISALYAAGAFWFAWRRKLVWFSWAGVALVFLAIAQVSHSLLAVRFPWQASCVFFAVTCVVGSLLARRFSSSEQERVFVFPLRTSAIAGSIAAASLLVAEIVWFRFQPSSLFASRAYILAVVWFGLLVLARLPIFSVAFQLTLAIGALLSLVAINGSMNEAVAVRSLQVDGIGAAAVALVLINTRKFWISNDTLAGLEHGFLICQKWLAISFVALFTAPTLLHLIEFPYAAGRATFAAGSFTGWLALLLTIVAVITIQKNFAKPIQAIGVAAALGAIASLTAFRGAEISVANWAGLHIFLGAFVIVAWLMLLARDWPCKRLATRVASRFGLGFHPDWAWDSEAFAAFAGVIAVLVALRGPFSDPAGAWWSIGALLAISALATSLNWITFRRGYLYAAGILFNLSVSIWIIKYQSQQISSLSAFVEANVIALSLAGVVWLYLELRKRRVQLNSEANSGAAFHNVAALASLLVIGVIVGVRLYADLRHFYPIFFPWLDALTLLSPAVLMIACLWDREAKYAVAGLYVIGLSSAATALHQLYLTPRHLVWSLMMAGAIQTLITAALWRARRPLIDWAARLRIPRRIDPANAELRWLLIFNCIIVSLIIAIGFWIEVVFVESSLRALAAVAVSAQAVTFGLMAQGKRRRLLQRTAVALLLSGLVFVGWSFLTPGATGTWLNRAVILMILTFAVVTFFGLGLNKLIEREPDWTRAFRDCIPAITITGIAALGFILATEIYYQIEFGAVRVSSLTLLTVALTLAAGIVVCIFFAVSPKHDPLALPDGRRGAYVYGAEVIVVLLFMHIRLTMPWLFHGFFQQYWPLVVLTIAYAGVAISEFFKRRNIRVLATPIERTGAFLPLLPVIGFWIAQSRVEYSTLLFIVGGLYGLLAILRRSFWFGLAAALAGNGGLWYLLHETSEYHFYQHPQLWLIPAAISVLIAAHLNRKDFSESQMTGIRYLCLTTIYASSTADIFINGVANSPWLPLVLAALSIAGVLAGMIFRVRAFLLLGSTFLLLAIVTMIKFASVNFGWTWLWYVAGIVTGAIIIATFAVFEKKRAEVLRVVDGLKDWKG